jgi:hypothetical protein
MSVHDVENAKHVDGCSYFIRFVPVEIYSDNSKVTFKLFSCIMLSCISILWGPLFLTLGAGEIVGRKIEELTDENIKKYNVVDEVARSPLKLFVIFVFPMCPIALGKALCSVPTIARDKDLKWPRNGAQLIISCCLFVIGSLLCDNACYVEKTTKLNAAKIFIIYLLPLFIYIMVTMSWMLPSLIVSSCIQKFVHLSQHKASQQPITDAKKCLKKYADLYKGFGSYFVFVL